MVFHAFNYFSALISYMFKQYQNYALLLLLFFTLSAMQQNGCKGKKNTAKPNG
jgi:hypothetical protein